VTPARGSAKSVAVSILGPRFRAWLARAPLGAALLALAVQLMFPAGFMAAEPGSGHGVPIVICTLQGQITMDWNAGSGTHKQTPAKPMQACPFAGHAVADGPPAPLAVSQPVAFEAFAPVAVAYIVYPGRGLAAPPPPAIGPPVTA
jgi:hypothetical protein